MRAILATALLALALAVGTPAAAQQVALKGLGRFEGWRENALVGYGLVTGLAGSGDTRRSAVTRQALRNVLNRLGTNVTDDQISSRNVAVVMVTAVLPASANVGDRIDVTVSSIGDARSIAGGTLIMTPLLGPDQRPYALAQGPLVTGGYSFESELNQQQRNYPTTALLQGGATVETPVEASILRDGRELAFLLGDPSFATAERIAAGINARLGAGAAWAKNADEVRIRYAGGPAALAGFVAQLEAVAIEPAVAPRLVMSPWAITTLEIVTSPPATTVAEGDRPADIEERAAIEQYYRARARAAVTAAVPGLAVTVRVLALPTEGGPIGAVMTPPSPGTDDAGRDFRLRVILVTPAALNAEDGGIVRDAVTRALALDEDRGDTLLFEVGALDAAVAPPVARPAELSAPAIPAAADAGSPDWSGAWVWGLALAGMAVLLMLYRRGGRDAPALDGDDHDAFAARLRRQLALQDEGRDAAA